MDGDDGNAEHLKCKKYLREDKEEKVETEAKIYRGKRCEDFHCV